MSLYYYFSFSFSFYSSFSFSCYSFSGSILKKFTKQLISQQSKIYQSLSSYSDGG